MRGRKASAVDAVAQTEASAIAKERAQAIYQVYLGQCTVAQACARLHVSPARFHQLQKQLMRSSVAGVEPRPAGRPRKVATPEQAQLAALERERQAMQVELGMAQTRAEIALVLPRVLQPAEAPAASAPEKKTRRRPAQRRPRAQRTRS